MVEIELSDGQKPVLLKYRDGNWEICWKRNQTNKDTKEVESVWSAEKWFKSPAAALNALAMMRVGNSNAKTLKELVEAIEFVHADIMSAYNTKPLKA